MAEPTPEVFVSVTRYEVSCLLPDHREYKNYKINVERHRDGRWSANDGFRELNVNGEWGLVAYGVRHRHDEETALRLARQAAPHMTCNGHTMAEALADGKANHA